MGITIFIIFVLAIAGAIIRFYIKNKKEPDTKLEKPLEPISEPSIPPVNEAPKEEETKLVVTFLYVKKIKNHSSLRDSWISFILTVQWHIVV